MIENATHIEKRHGPLGLYKILQNQPSGRVRLAQAMHLEPGVVRYEGMGENGSDLTLFLPKETIDRMRHKFAGAPVVNETHKPEADIGSFSRGDADGVVTESYWDSGMGQEIVRYMVWTQEAVNNLESGKYGVSCSYTVTNRDMTPGTWHNVPYDGTILDGEYNHLAIVPNPRYEESRNTLLNAKGGEGMFKLLLKKLGIENSVEVDGAKSSIEVGGKKVALKDAVAKYLEAENAVPEVLADDVLVTLANGTKVTVADIKKKLSNADAAPGVTEGQPQPKTGPMNATGAPGVNMPPDNQPPTGPMNAKEDEEKKKKEEEEKAENARKAKEAENARLENERKATAAADAAKAKALEDAARLRDTNLENSERPYITEADALARGRAMFGKDVPAAR